MPHLAQLVQEAAASSSCSPAFLLSSPINHCFINLEERVALHLWYRRFLVSLLANTEIGLGVHSGPCCDRGQRKFSVMPSSAVPLLCSSLEDPSCSPAIWPYKLVRMAGWSDKNKIAATWKEFCNRMSFLITDIHSQANVSLKPIKLWFPNLGKDLKLSTGANSCLYFWYKGPISHIL